MHILAINPYHGGSHRAFIEHWIKHSEHHWTLLSLPPRHWKWRMRHAPIYFAKQVSALEHQQFDLIFTTDMLNVAEFKGLAGKSIQDIPSVIYFHENQLMYPDQHATEKDLHYAFTNFISACAADQVWFNSQWHLESFFEFTHRWLKNMPDFQPHANLAELQKNALTHYPGIDIDATIHGRSARKLDQPVTILWAARWEADKNPQCLFAALRILVERNIPFNLNFIGGSVTQDKELFDQAQKEFQTQINQWGFVEDRGQYLDLLANSDLVVSTALHEFFGIAVLEAVASGCVPLVPNGLAYPETLAAFYSSHPECFFDGSPLDLADKITQLIEAIKNPDYVRRLESCRQQTIAHLIWPERAKHLDRALRQAARIRSDQM